MPFLVFLDFIKQIVVTKYCTEIFIEDFFTNQVYAMYLQKIKWIAGITLCFLFINFFICPVADKAAAVDNVQQMLFEAIKDGRENIETQMPIICSIQRAVDSSDLTAVEKISERTENKKDQI